MNEPICPACDSLDYNFLGTLGTLDHFRCRDCGMDYSIRQEDDEDDCDDDGRFSTDAEADEDAVGGPDCDDSDDGYALASAGWGTDEDYNHYDYGD